jgi:hypothetical protein
MKKLVFVVAILGALILGTTSTVKAQSATFYCILTINDTCNGGGYHGNYDVEIELYFNGTLQCSASGTSTSGTHCVLFTCSFIPNQTLPEYEEKSLKVQRSGGTCGGSSGQDFPGLYWSEISTCNSNTPHFTVNL